MGFGMDGKAVKKWETIVYGQRNGGVCSHMLVQRCFFRQGCFQRASCGKNRLGYMGRPSANMNGTFIFLRELMG